ncbi:MAG: class I SAM-dependent methyltransferase [Gammaproteobacteria bacterium]|nr:class I SAM-dependent methyltransferase [Gammaproteobacteria bacterium]
MAEPAQNTAYQARIAQEIENFSDVENVHELPEIFHYWSNMHLLPEQQKFGINSPDHFFLENLLKVCATRDGTRMISIGSGNCDLEARLAQGLVEAGFEEFTIECMDINPQMLERGKAHAAAQGVADFIRFREADFNAWDPEGRRYDAVVANQSLHHVLELEHLFGAVGKAVGDSGVFLVSDMIGRNGHLRWPEARAIVDQFWNELPQAYRYNQLLQRHEQVFLDNDCSSHSFEGIRAQDILPLLVQRFHFDFFFPYGNIIFPFVDRAFGHNFDATADWDRDFIDRVHIRDEQELLAGNIKPTAMLAAMRNSGRESMLRDPKLTPEFCVRQPGQNSQAG